MTIHYFVATQDGSDKKDVYIKLAPAVYQLYSTGKIVHGKNLNIHSEHADVIKAFNRAGYLNSKTLTPPQE